MTEFLKSDFCGGLFQDGPELTPKRVHDKLKCSSAQGVARQCHACVCCPGHPSQSKCVGYLSRRTPCHSTTPRLASQDASVRATNGIPLPGHAANGGPARLPVSRHRALPVSLSHSSGPAHP